MRSNPSRAACVVALHCCIALMGCEDGDGMSAVGGCDIRVGSCQRDVFRRTAEAREQAGARMPAVRTIDLAALERELSRLVEDDGGATTAWSGAMQLLGLLPQNLALDEAVVSDGVDGIAAYYEESERRVTVVDRGDVGQPLDDVFVLSHEFVHALQDQTGHLTPFLAEWADSTDASASLTALIEGEAVVLAASVLEDAAPPGTALDWEALADAIEGGIFDYIESSEVPFISAVSQLPYPLGTSDLTQRYRTMGLRGIAEQYDAPRLSLLQWPLATVDTEIEPLDCLPTGAPEGYVAVDHDRFGVAALTAYGVRAGQSTGTALGEALAWRNDSVVVFAPMDAAQASEVAVAWRVRMADAEAADALASRLGELVPGLEVAAVDRELLAFAASDGAVAAGWSQVTGCGGPGDLPDRSEQDGASMMAARPRGLRLR